jgi:solute carrier family 13 (sodium-dependent dicarboxylate transporter), member 2/3/5
MRTLLFRFAGPLAGAATYGVLHHLGHAPAAMAGIVLWMAVWWITEAVAIPVTALLPLVLFPLLGVQGLADTAAHYGRDIIFLFIGGFLLALGVERSGLHNRFALWTVSRIGASPPRLVLGTLLASGLLSMWINSTAAVLVMLPIALSLLRTTDGAAGLGAVLALAVSYGATIGGMATPVGTPPNLVMMALWKQEFPAEPAIGFGQWMLFGVPYALLFLFITWLLLTRVLFRLPGAAAVERHALRAQLNELGSASRDERLAGLVFACTALLWMTGDDIVFTDTFTLHGWRGLLGLQRMGDPAVGMVGGIVLFLLPAKGEKRNLLDWDFAQQRIPWGVVLLIGSGFAIAGGIDASGLSAVLGKTMLGWRAGSDLVQVGAIAAGVTLLSELGSNTAVASLVLPILARTAEAWDMAPLMVMIPATLAASCGFMLPIASPMQAIVFASGHLTVKQMVKAGVWMDILGVLLLMGLWAVLGEAVFG